MSSPTIVIVGAGFSGTLVSLWLQTCTPEGTRICLIERDDRFGTGLAYRSANPNHLLNVPVGRMSAFPDRPLDFLQWLQAHSEVRLGDDLPTAGSFVPRSLYGAYLQQLLRRAVDDRSRGHLELIAESVVDVTDAASGVLLRLASGTTLTADLVVLATGNPPPTPPHADTALLEQAGLWRADPWGPSAFTYLDPDAPVLLVGTGLTMVDSVISLLDAGHTGPIHALSRRGLLPRRHAVQHGAPVALPSPMPTGLAPLIRWFRREVARNIEAGNGWHPAMEALRPVTQNIWRGLSPSERQRFRRHLCAWWDVHRHRVPPQIADRIEAARAAGQLQIHAGRIAACEVDQGEASIVFRRRSTGELRRLRAARVINCTGPCTNVTLSADPMMRSLLRAGAVRPDALRLGLDTTAGGAVIGADGASSERLFAVGPLTKGSWWEITAVPDIRAQCRDLAERLARVSHLVSS